MNKKEQKIVNLLKKNKGSISLEIPYYIGRLGIYEMLIDRHGYAVIKVTRDDKYPVDIDEFYIQSETDMSKSECYNEILRVLTTEVADKINLDKLA